MDHIAPRPGPHLSPSTTTYRELAKRHAQAANVILSDQGDNVADPDQLDALLAIAHALTSIAFSDAAPPARHRPRCTCRPSPRVVTP